MDSNNLFIPGNILDYDSQGLCIVLGYAYQVDNIFTLKPSDISLEVKDNDTIIYARSFRNKVPDDTYFGDGLFEKDGIHMMDKYYVYKTNSNIILAGTAWPEYKLYPGFLRNKTLDGYVDFYHKLMQPQLIAAGIRKEIKEFFGDT